MSMEPAAALRAIARVTARELHTIASGDGAGVVMAEAPDKVRALLDAVRVLDAAGAPYALIGGVAVGVHSGLPRATLDTDIAVHTGHRGPALTSAFAAAHFELRGGHAHSENLRHAGGEPVQLAFDPEFDPMIARAEVFSLDGTAIRVVSKADLIAMKRRAAADPARRRSKSLRDLADVELLLGDVPGEDEGW